MTLTNVRHGALSSRELCERSGATYRQVDYWCRTKALEPYVPAQGSGTQRVFDNQEVLVARAFVALQSIVDPKLSALSLMSDLADHVRAHGLHGAIEIMSGVTVDIERLIDPSGLGTTASPTTR